MFCLSFLHLMRRATYFSGTFGVGNNLFPSTAFKSRSPKHDDALQLKLKQVHLWEGRTRICGEAAFDMDCGDHFEAWRMDLQMGREECMQCFLTPQGLWGPLWPRVLGRRIDSSGGVSSWRCL